MQLRQKILDIYYGGNTHTNYTPRIVRYEAMKGNRLEDGLRVFRGILHAVLVNAVGTQAEAAEAKKLVVSAREYVVAMSIELERRKLVGKEQDLSSFSDDIKKRSLELSAYFTVPAMEPMHQTLALFSAMGLANKNKQLGSALGFANALIERGTNAKFKENVCKAFSNTTVLKS